mmetsp:Transcript_11061/g.16094  ORF Transcript_11061/g.16094 Transcript_11061/m.16094 type:complete len:376 (-) Transcript_11061:249-1376(-)
MPGASASAAPLRDYASEACHQRPALGRFGWYHSWWGPPSGLFVCGEGAQHWGWALSHSHNEVRLLDQPCLELSVQIVTVVCPPLIVIGVHVTSVCRIGWHMGRHVDAQLSMLTNQRRRRGTGWAVRDVGRLIRKTLRVGCELQEVHDAGFAVSRQTGGNDPAVQVKGLHVPEHTNRLVLLSNGREQTTIVGRTHDNFAIGQQLGCFRTSRPPDNAFLDGVELGQGLGYTFVGAQNVIDVVLGNAVAIQSPLKVVDWTLLQRTFAGELRQVKHVTNSGRSFGANQVGAVAKCGRVNDLWHKAVGNQQIAKVFGRRGAIGGCGQICVMVDFIGQTFVAQAHGVGRNRINQIPGDIAGFVHGTQFRNSFARAFVPDDF